MVNSEVTTLCVAAAVTFSLTGCDSSCGFSISEQGVSVKCSVDGLSSGCCSYMTENCIYSDCQVPPGTCSQDELSQWPQTQEQILEDCKASASAEVSGDAQVNAAMPPDFALPTVTLQAATASAQPPTQPHLAQAWTAMSSGDGLPGQTGKESYFVSSDNKFKAHKYEYPEAGCTKISLHDPSQLHHIMGAERNYYLGCDAVNCCYSDFSMKIWDIEKPGLLASVGFVGYEDTTELNDNPVRNAEHWRQSTKLPGKVGIGYEYYIHRTEDADVVSHRIGYNVSGADVPAGSILYGDFQVQHDLDTFRGVFTPPAECLKPTVLKCPDQQVDTWDKKHFKHDHALRKLQSELVV